MIHFTFPRPDSSGQVDYLAGSMTAYVEHDGWREAREAALEDIDPVYLPALQGAIMSIVSLGEDWQAVQAWADKETESRMIEGELLEIVDVVALRVEARHVESKAIRIFSSADYPILTLSEPAMVAFYEYFTQQNQ